MINKPHGAPCQAARQCPSGTLRQIYLYIAADSPENAQEFIAGCARRSSPGRFSPLGTAPRDQRLKKRVTGSAPMGVPHLLQSGRGTGHRLPRTSRKAQYVALLSGWTGSVASTAGFMSIGRSKRPNPLARNSKPVTLLRSWSNAGGSRHGPDGAAPCPSRRAATRADPPRP